jgi:hypothetical protein
VQRDTDNGNRRNTFSGAYRYCDDDTVDHRVYRQSYERSERCNFVQMILIYTIVACTFVHVHSFNDDINEQYHHETAHYPQCGIHLAVVSFMECLRDEHEKENSKEYTCGERH